MNFFRQPFHRISLLTLLAMLAISTRAIAAPPPVEDFFRYESFGHAVMSPSGNHVAATVKSGKTGRRGLVVFDARDLTKTAAVAIYADADVNNVNWVNDERLVFSVMDLQAPVGEQRGGGLFAVDREGKQEIKNLVRRWFTSDEIGGMVAASGTRTRDSGLSIFHHFRQAIEGGGNDIVVERFNYDDDRQFRGTNLLRLDTVTGAAKALATDAPDFVYTWVLDAQGNPRAAITILDQVARLHLKAGPATAWLRTQQWRTFGETREIWNPIAVDSANRIYATSRSGKSADFESLVRKDMSAADLTWQEIIALDGYDFNGDLVWGKDGKLLGIRFLTDARTTHWLDARLKAIQADVDKLLPGLINEMSCGLCENPERVLVTSWSDRQPNFAQIFDVQSKTFKPLAASRPWIKAAEMGPRAMYRVTTPDGLKMPVHVTLPTGATGPTPAVVLVHGGPYVRGGSWKWDASAQFLATRGYTVIEPEYRGSTGFGDAHFKAGWKQWGLAMQDDVALATRWAVEKGLADGKRICIAGASYGGYAAMMGLVRHSELYRCGVNWVGVTDMDLLFTARWSDFSDLWKEYGMPVLVGDRKTDAAQFEKTSPVKQAALIKKPVLMAYGDADRRVPIRHGFDLKSAIESSKGEVEWITYADEGHGWILESNNVDFWKRVERFLNKNTAK